MEHASKERFTAQNEEAKKQTIKATDEWYEELQKMPFVSRKNGKMLNLLKASAKKINPNKRRKVIPILGNIKKFHKDVSFLEKAKNLESSQGTGNIQIEGL